MSSEQQEWTGPGDHPDTVLHLRRRHSRIQYLGAHAAHLEATIARGFTVEVTLM